MVIVIPKLKIQDSICICQQHIQHYEGNRSIKKYAEQLEPLKQAPLDIQKQYSYWCKIAY
jgi:hypothetical protein